MPQPFFSVIIPTYNRAEFVSKAIGSVLTQDFGDFEVIVVDDGSTDNTESAVACIADPRVRYFKKVNGERGAARNFGVHQSRGEYVTFLDSDDQVYAHHLSTAFSFIKEHDQAPVFHLGFDRRDELGKLLAGGKKISRVRMEILDGNVLSCNGVFARRQLLMENPFSEDRALSSLEDWELWIRLSARYEFLHGDTVTSTVIQHQERSVMDVDASRIAAKVNVFVRAVTGDPQNVLFYGRRLRRPVASAYTYAALHLLLGKNHRKLAFDYFVRGVAAYPGVLFTRRSAVILLKLLGVR